MKLTNYPYIEKTIKMRKMTISSLLLMISQALIKAGKTETEIRIMDLTNANMIVFDTMNDMLAYDWGSDWEILVHDVTPMERIKDSSLFVRVLVSDPDDEEE